MYTIILLLCCAIFTNVQRTEQADFLEDNYIQRLNKVAVTWKAGVNFHPKTSVDDIKRLLGSYALGSPKTEPVKVHDAVYLAETQIPKTFDARNKWNYCTTIKTVRDQGNCGSCWAFSTSSALSDRLCIASEGTFDELLSAEQLTFCCRRCGYGCNGGYPIRAWGYFHRNGIVTGGNYNTTQGCQPYQVPPCVEDKTGHNTCENQPIEKNHKCQNICYGDTGIKFKKDHRYTRNTYYLSSPKSMQQDVLAYGPIETSFHVFDDFLSYKSGVYSKTAVATYLGDHSVKLIGWGEDNGVPYWLIMNSWNDSWGDKGLFKILRGSNECKIEENPTGGEPKIK
ncbi:cathepsin B-like [Adelges cooleyi]|uniref:cathepsin B-like n=1 Tax=Adelges cooleyi TaxID=133065 RepID=UPI00218029A2|nr:cathepsin B-like [Adelges cooleyi]